MLSIKKAVVVVVLCLGSASLIDGAVKLGDLVAPCSLKDPQLDDCLTTQGKAILSYLVAGVPDLDMAPIDPLFIQQAGVQREGGQYNSLNITLTNSTHLGYKDVAINSIRFDPKSNELNLNMFFPWYNISGMYDMNGHLLLVPIYGNGRVEKLNFKDANMTTTIQFEREEREGDAYLKITDVKTISDTKRIIVQFDNLFGNSGLTAITNNLLNRNSAAVLAEIKSDIGQMLSNIVSSLLTVMFTKIPLNELFKDVE